MLKTKSPIQNLVSKKSITYQIYKVNKISTWKFLELVV
eukprot:UN06735